jgi:hypothetical protein
LAAWILHYRYLRIDGQPPGEASKKQDMPNNHKNQLARKRTSAEALALGNQSDTRGASRED